MYKRLTETITKTAATAVAVVAMSTLVTTARAAEQVDVAIISFAPYAPWYIVQQRHMARDIDLNIRIIEGIQAKNSAMTAGNIQCMNNTADSIVSARSNGVPMQIVAYSDMSYGLDKMVVTKDIHSAKDFKGKSYGADLGFLNHMWMLLTLERAGLSHDDASLVVLLPQQSTAAFVAGSIDIDVNYLPFVAQDLQRHGAHILKSSLSDRTWERGLIGDSIACNSKWLERNPDTARKLLRAWFQAVDWWKEHPKEGNRIVADGLGWDEDDVRLNMHGAIELNLSQNLGAFGIEGGQAVCKSLPNGVPKAPPDSKGWGALFNGKDCVNGYAGPTWDLFNRVYKAVGVAGSDVPAADGLNPDVVRGLKDAGYLDQYRSNEWIGRLPLPAKYDKEELWQAQDG